MEIRSMEIPSMEIRSMPAKSGTSPKNSMTANIRRVSIVVIYWKCYLDARHPLRCERGCRYRMANVPPSCFVCSQSSNDKSLFDAV